MASSDNESTSIGSKMIAKANNSLALNVHKVLAAEKQNVFFSPFSLSTALAMVYCGAKGETAEEMRGVLGYDYAMFQNSVSSYYSEILEAMKKGNDGYTLSYANSLLSQKGFLIQQEYRSLMETSFKALLMEVDFLEESGKVVDHINRWVKEKTKDMIPHLLDSLDPQTVLVILNAVYFKGTWLHQFKKGSTYVQNFYNRGSELHSKPTEMMHLKKRFPFVEKKTYDALQLPYVGDDASMFILLPHARNGLAEVESSLVATFVEDLRKEMRVTTVKVALPKFRMEYSKPLKDVLQVLGMNRAFRRGADFQGISNSRDLCVTEVVHKAVLEVNEEGSEASASTAIMVQLCCATIDPVFTVDHPFLFVVYDVKNNLSLFMGRVEEL